MQGDQCSWTHFHPPTFMIRVETLQHRQTVRPNANSNSSSLHKVTLHSTLQFLIDTPCVFHVQWTQCILLINCESRNVHWYVLHLINYTVLLWLRDKTATKCEYEVIQLSSTMSGFVQSQLFTCSVSSMQYRTYLHCSHIRVDCSASSHQ